MICLFFLLFTTFSSNKLFSQTISVSFSNCIEEIIQKADELKLYEDKGWLSLLLYEKKIFGYKSTVETPAFFLAKDGRTNPKSELQENIKAFLNGKSINFFPARFKWLKDKLNLSDDIFPTDCEKEYATAKEAIKPTAAYIIFPAGYMKNPASMFGHAFLLFENENKPLLMGESVSYGARATNNPGFIYALKGLFGLYYGEYAVEMYSKQILKYRDIDMRDIWEYKLKMSEEQLDMLFRHTMEISLIATKYYYVGKNCTYYMMKLLESAYPNENLGKELGNVAEPLKSIKILYKKGLTEEPIYRSSLNTIINEERKLLGKKNSSIVKKYCKGSETIETLKNTFNSEDELSLALKLASDYLKYLLASSLITQNEYKSRIMPVFTSLSKIKNKQQKVLESTEYPHKSHDSKKITITGGFDDNEAFSQIYFRFVNHDLIDEDFGLNKNTQLSFLTGSFSIYPKQKFENGKVKLDNLYFTHITSLPVSDSFFLNKAIDVIVGLERNQKSNNENDLAFRLKLFSGVSLKLTSSNQMYFLAGLDSYTNPNYDYYVDLLPGAEIGLLTTVGIWKQHLIGLVEQGIFKNDGTTGKDGLIDKESFKNRDRLRFDLSAEERLTISRNTAISVKYNFYGDYKEYNHKVAITGHFNF